MIVIAKHLQNKSTSYFIFVFIYNISLLLQCFVTVEGLYQCGDTITSSIISSYDINYYPVNVRSITNYDNCGIRSILSLDDQLGGSNILLIGGLSSYYDGYNFVTGSGVSRTIPVTNSYDSCM